VVVLSGLAVTAAVLAQPTLAGIAGTAAVGLAGDLGRRLMRPDEPRRSGR
jgi:hypothetical protein